MNRYSDGVSGPPVARVVSGLRWRADAMRNRLRELPADGLSDHIRCRVELGFALPPLESGIVVFDDYDVSHSGVTRAVHRLLDEDPTFEVAGANRQGVEFGSLCLRRTRPPNS